MTIQIQTRPSQRGLLRVQSVVSGGTVRIVLAGEADMSTVDDLEMDLELVDLDSCTTVRIDVTGLGFADVATIHRLAVFATNARQTGHEVTTLGASPMFRKVATIMGAQDDLGLDSRP
jgi:anti-anti-sigma regulatory factor